MKQRRCSFLSYNRGLAGNTYSGRMEDSERITQVFPGHFQNIKEAMVEGNQKFQITYLMIMNLM